MGATGQQTQSFNPFATSAVPIAPAILGPLEPNPAMAVRVPPPGGAVSAAMAAGVISTADPDDAKTEADLTEEYIALRDRKKEVADRHVDELAPLNDRMGAIEQLVLARLNASGVESVRTTKGTAFKKTTTRYNVADGEKLFQWIEANGRLDMVTRGIRQEAVREFAEETNSLPPGLDVFSQVVVQFRK